MSFKIICDLSVRVYTNSSTLHFAQYCFFLKSVFSPPIVSDLQEAIVRCGQRMQLSMLSV